MVKLSHNEILLVVYASYSSSDPNFFHSVVLRQRAEEVANLERELRELQITAERLVEKRNQNQKHFEQTEGRLQKQQEGKHIVS